MVHFRERLQAPGNGQIFDGRLFSGSKMTSRTIGALEYLSINDGCSWEKFEKEIKNHLASFFDHKINDSNEKHFARPLIYYNFVKVIKNKLYLTTVGTAFLKACDEKDETKALNIFIEQLQCVEYPNSATPRVIARTRVFRLLFHLLLRHQVLTKEFCLRKLPYITDFSKFSNNLDEIASGSQQDYYQLYGWVIQSLCSLGILAEGTQGEIKIHLDYMDVIEEFFTSDNVYKLFHFNNEEMEVMHSSNRQSPRNSEVKDAALKRDNYTDRITAQRRTRKNNKGNPLCEAHHIIAIEHHQYFSENYGVDIDQLENIICVTADTHDALHHACDIDRKDYLVKAYTCISEKFKKSIEMDFIKYAKLYKFDAGI